MLVSWHPLRWWNWCMPEDEKKRRLKSCGMMYKIGKNAFSTHQ